MLKEEYNCPSSAHACLTLLSTCAKGAQFYCPSHTYAAIPYCTIFFHFEPIVLCTITTARYISKNKKKDWIKIGNMTSKNPFFVLSIIIGPTGPTYSQPFVSPKIPSPFVGTLGHYGRWEWEIRYPVYNNIRLVVHTSCN